MIHNNVNISENSFVDHIPSFSLLSIFFQWEMIRNIAHSIYKENKRIRTKTHPSFWISLQLWLKTLHPHLLSSLLFFSSMCYSRSNHCRYVSYSLLRLLCISDTVPFHLLPASHSLQRISIRIGQFLGYYLWTSIFHVIFIF